MASPDRFDHSVSLIDVPITLLGSNQLGVQVRGKPGATILVEILGLDTDPPTIHATATPPPNAYGWNTSAVVTFACDDATSGVASCPAPITVTTEGAHQVIQGTAVDLAGNTATASVTLNIDHTPPTIQAAVSPAPNASGWNNADVTVTFTCADALSGVAFCPAPVTVRSEGAHQVVSGTASDRAGNMATTSVTLNIDKTPPTLGITSPVNGVTVSTPTITVMGNVSDALSGVVSVTCNGFPATVTNSNFSCNQTLTAGANTIVVQASDLAGNTAQASVGVTLGGPPQPPPSAVVITPGKLTMLVSDIQVLQLVDNLGRAVTGATFTVTDSTVAQLSTTAPVVLTAQAAGHVTVTATFGNLSAQADVNILTGTSLPPGTVRWSVPPMPGFATTQIVQAAPVGETGPDLYAVESGANQIVVRGFKADGRQKTFTRLTSSGTLIESSSTNDPLRKAVPDQAGGLLLLFGGEFTSYNIGPVSRIVRVGPDGTVSWTYEDDASPTTLFDDIAVSPEGTIFAVQDVNQNLPPGDRFLLALDGSTGMVKFLIPLPHGSAGQLNFFCNPGLNLVSGQPAVVGAPMVASDGSVFLEVATYDYLTDWEPCGTYTRTFQSTLSLLRVAPDGASSMTPLKATSTVTSSSGAIVGPIEEVFPGETIPDGQGGVLASWADVVFALGPFFGTPTTQRTTKVTHVLNGGLNEYELPLIVNQSNTFPVIDRFPVGPPSGSLVLGENGEAFASDGQKVIAFDMNTGSVQWTFQPASGKVAIVAAAADGQLVAKVTQNGLDTVARFDATGVPTFDTWTAPAVQYALGDLWFGTASTDALAALPVDLAFSIWRTPNGDHARRQPSPKVEIRAFKGSSVMFRMRL